VVFFYPLGLWADRWSKNGVVVICTIGTIISCMLLAPLLTTPYIWPLVVLIFTSAFGVYVVALALIGDVFKGRDMVAASAAVAAMWGVGGIVGPPIAGRVIDSFGINSFPLTLSGFYTILLLGLLAQRGQVVKQA
jgi:MFS family permease